MRIVWTPEDGGEPREYSFKPETLRSVVAEAIELEGGPAWETWPEWRRLFIKGHARAQRAGLWQARREAGEPNLAFHQVDVRAGDIWVGYDDDDRADAVRRVKEATDLDEATKADIIASLGGDPGADADPLPESSEPSGSPAVKEG